MTKYEDVDELEQIDDFLTHYGVKGMKWGKKKNPHKNESYTQDPLRTAEFIMSLPPNKRLGHIADMYSNNREYGDAVINELPPELKKKLLAQLKRARTQAPLKQSSIDTDLEDFLAHYGVLGMKWGVRKDRRSGSSGSSRTRKQRRANKRAERRSRKERRSNPQTSKDTNQNRSVKRSNTLKNNPQNRYVTTQELNEIVTRLRLESEIARFTAQLNPQPVANKNRVKEMLKDAMFDASKQAVTSVGKAVMTQALGTTYNKLVKEGSGLQIKVAAGVGSDDKKNEKNK